MKIQEVRLEAARLVFSRLDTIQAIDKSQSGIIKIIENLAEYIAKGKKPS